MFVLVTDVTDRARAEAALRLSNWQLGEERARLGRADRGGAARPAGAAPLQRIARSAREAAHGAALAALGRQSEARHRLRATFATDLIFQGFLDVDGTVLDANPASLAAIQCHAGGRAGQPFWDTPWFTEHAGRAGARPRGRGRGAARARPCAQNLVVNLPGGTRELPVLAAARAQRAAGR